MNHSMEQNSGKIFDTLQLTKPGERGTINNNSFINNVSSRLDAWTKNRQVQIERSTYEVLNQRVSEISTSDALKQTEQQLTYSMEGIYNTALAKVHEMKDAKLDEDTIRNTVLPTIQNMQSPFAENNPLNNKFKELHQQVYDSVDSKIIGEEKVFNRNLNASSSKMNF